MKSGLFASKTVSAGDGCPKGSQWGMNGNPAIIPQDHLRKVCKLTESSESITIRPHQRFGRIASSGYRVLQFWVLSRNGSIDQANQAVGMRMRFVRLNFKMRTIQFVPVAVATHSGSLQSEIYRCGLALKLALRARCFDRTTLKKIDVMQKTKAELNGYL